MNAPIVRCCACGWQVPVIYISRFDFQAEGIAIVNPCKCGSKELVIFDKPEVKP